MAVKRTRAGMKTAESKEVYDTKLYYNRIFEVKAILLTDLLINDSILINRKILCPYRGQNEIIKDIKRMIPATIKIKTIAVRITKECGYALD